MTARGKTASKRKLVLGVGLNDLDFPTQRLPYVDESGVYHKKWTHPIYKYWKNVLSRSNCPSYHEKFPAYADVQVVDEWKKLSNFFSWAEERDYNSGKVLDKDILGDGKLYSPETCCFIDPRVNNFLVGHALKGTYLKGVSFEADSFKFKATLSMLNRSKNLGRYSTEYEAHLVYAKAKLNYAIEIINEYKVEDYIATALIAKLQKKVDKAEILYQQSLI